MHQNLIPQQIIDNWQSLVEVVIPALDVPQQAEHQRAKNHVIDVSPVMTSPQDLTAKKNIGMSGPDFAFSIPTKLGNTEDVVHIGTYLTRTDAYRAQNQLEQSDQHHRKMLPFARTRLTSPT